MPRAAPGSAGASAARPDSRLGSTRSCTSVMPPPRSPPRPRRRVPRPPLRAALAPASCRLDHRVERAQLVAPVRRSELAALILLDAHVAGGFDELMQRHALRASRAPRRRRRPRRRRSHRCVLRRRRRLCRLHEPRISDCRLHRRVERADVLVRSVEAPLRAEAPAKRARRPCSRWGSSHSCEATRPPPRSPAPPRSPSSSDARVGFHRRVVRADVVPLAIASAE